MTAIPEAATPRRRRPGVFRRAPVTVALVGLCVAVWVVEVLVPGLIDDLALSADRALDQPWRWVTSAFTHSLSPAHIGFNMLALWLVGPWLEGLLGRLRFLALHLLSALGGAVTFVAGASPPTAANPLGVGWYTGLVGASGAVFGLFGALVVVQRRLGHDTRGLWTVLVLNGALSFIVPGIAWQAHAGGFVVGLATTGLLLRRPRRGPSAGVWAWLVLLGAGAVLTGVVAATAALRW